MVVSIFKHPTRILMVLLAIIVLFSYGQSINFSLWQDDNALIFKLQHLDEQAGVFGPGPLGLGAYRYIALPYIPIYKLFGANIPIFYSWAILFYFLASVSIFILAREFSKNNLLALLSGSIFASGFIGSDGIIRLFNSIQTSYSVIFVTLTFFFLYRFIQTKRFSDYFLALVFFLISLETAFIRTQYLIFPVVIFCILFLLNWRNVETIIYGFLKILPFIAIYLFIFFQNPDPRNALLGDFFGGLFRGSIEYTHGFFGTIGNIILPDPITQSLFSLASFLTLDYSNRLVFLQVLFLIVSLFILNLILRKEKRFVKIGFFAIQLIWSIILWVFFFDAPLLIRHSLEKHTIDVFANFIGGTFLILALATFLVVFRNKQKIGLLLFFLVSWLSFNALAYSVYLPFTPFETIHRYLVHSLAAYSLFLPLAIFNFTQILSKKRAFIFATVIVSLFVILNVSLSIDYQKKFIIGKSIPTKRFYEKLRSLVHRIEKNTVFYFDVADDEVSQQHFRDFFSVGSMPDTTAIAIRYGVDRYDLHETNDFDEFLSIIAKEKTPQDKIFSFFYRNGELVDTSQTIRYRLENGEKLVLGSRLEFPNIDFSTATPIILEIEAKAKLINRLTGATCPINVSTQDKKLIFEYLLSRDNLKEGLKVKTSSQEKYQKSLFLADNRVDTLWRGNRGWWHENRKEEIFIDLGVTKSIGQFIWINGYSNSTPTDYELLSSTDRKNWRLIKHFKSDIRRANGAVIIENFPPKGTRYLKMVINKTFDNDSPAISEIEIIEENFIGINRQNVQILENKSMDCIENREELSFLQDYINKAGIMTNLIWRTNKHSGWSTENVRDFRLIPDGLYHKYEIILPAGGTEFEYLKIEPTVPIEINVYRVKLIAPDKNELFEKLMIKL